MKTVAKTKGLTQRAGVYWLRVVVPKDLVNAFNGAKDICRSLGTRDKRDAERKAAEIRVDFERRFAEARQSTPKPVTASATAPAAPKQPFTEAHISHLVTAHARALKARRDLDRIELFEKAKADPDAFWRGEIVQLPEDGEIVDGGPAGKLFASYWQTHIVGNDDATLRDGVACARTFEQERRLRHLEQAERAGDISDTINDARKLCEQHTLDADGNDLKRLALALLQADITYKREERDAAFTAISLIFAAGIVTAAASPAIASPAAAAPSEPQAHAVKLSAALERYAKAQDAHVWKSNREDAVRAATRIFIECVGDKPLDAYSKADATTFRETVGDLPPNWRKLGTLKSLSAPKAAKKARDLKLDRCSLSTVAKNLSIMSAFFTWSMNNLDHVTLNPFAYVAGKKKNTSGRDEADPFTNEQLQIIFNAPIYTGCESETHWQSPGSMVLRDSEKFWVPLIALFTGMRANEICQLRARHVKTHNRSSYLQLGRDFRFKNDNSMRNVPLHQALIDVGFLDFVASRRAANGPDARLFHKIAQTSKRKGENMYSDVWGKHFARFLKSLGLRTADNARRTTFHSFRHTFIEQSERDGLNEGAQERIVGHAHQGEGARYGASYEKRLQDMALLERYANEMAKITYRDLDLSHLKLASAKVSAATPVPQPVAVVA